jgi:predicted peptidase
MTTLFRRIKPAQNFRITQRQIAKFLRIPESYIVKIESWLYVLFVHRTDKGGQFISYRQMEQWKNAIACHIQKCSTCQQLEQLWNAILHDHTKHNPQYDNSVFPFLEKLWTIQAVQTVGTDSTESLPEYLALM